MFKKFLLALILLSFMINFSSALETENLEEKMISGLNKDNSKSVVIPGGKKGVLNLFIEQVGKSDNNDNVYKNPIKITYNGIVSSFNIMGDIAITQNDNLIFAVNNDDVYIKACGDCSEKLSIYFNSFNYIYKKDNVTIKHKDKDKNEGKEYIFSEALYDKEKNIFKIYENGEFSGTVFLDDVQE